MASLAIRAGPSPSRCRRELPASTALSWADGIAEGRRLRGEAGRHTVAVIGDGALTGGMAWETINNIAVDTADQFHSVGKINPETGLPFEVAGRSWTDELSEGMVQVGRDRPGRRCHHRSHAHPGRARPLRRDLPDRVFDVGVAGQHAVTMASGLAFAGRHPVVTDLEARLR